VHRAGELLAAGPERQPDALRHHGAARPLGGHEAEAGANEAQTVKSTSAVGGTFHSFAITGIDDATLQCVGRGPVLIRVTTPKGNTTDLLVTVSQLQ